jgi:hypothetical protein
MLSARSDTDVSTILQGIVMIDTEKFANALRANARLVSRGQCAKYVRLALTAGGANTQAHPGTAKSYGPLLERNGYTEIEVVKPESFAPEKGDIVVFRPVKHGNQAGHIQGYDGKGWVSDFVQTGFWPGPTYRKEKPAYVVYRP